MTIDIRANVTCSLGNLISGSISDGYIQGGLVFISGSCEIRGLITPAMGQVVTFAYERDGVTTTIPRQLRVLGSFADPFRNTTRVELGCTLTYLRDARPLPEDAETEDPDAKAQSRTPEELNCRYPDPDYPTTPGLNGQPAVPGYINASAVLSECCIRLGIASTGGALTARYYVEEFDYSSGYVNVISQLLDTESKFGFINAGGALQISSLEAGGGTGPALTSDNIIDISPVAIGEVVPSKVVVRFNSLVLKELPEDALTPGEGEGNEEGATNQVYDNWEKVSTVGKPTSVTIYYKHPFTGANESVSTRYIPYSETITTYGSGAGIKPKFNEETCEWEQTSKGPDLTNSVVKRETKTRRVLAEANGNYCSEILSTLRVYYLPGAIFPIGQVPAGYGENRFPPLSKEGDARVVETFEYDNQGNVTRQITEIYEPFFVFIGRLDIPYVYYGLADGQTTIDQLSIEGSEVLVQRTITTVENIYYPGELNVQRYGYYFGFASTLRFPERRPPLGQRVKTETWINNALTQNGQQAIATFKKQKAFATTLTATQILLTLTTELKLEDQQIEVTRNRQLLNTPGRPTQQELASAKEKNTSGDSQNDVQPAADQSGRIENTAQFEVVHSGVLNPNILDTSLPLSPDDVYGANGKVINGQGAAFARRYGRTQLRMIWGRRYGLNVQLHPDKMPAYPYSPLYVSANGVMVQYRANGTNWAFSSDGVAASTDGLFMGVVGGAGGAWVPVAPGVTTFPPAPTPTGSGEVDPDAPIPPYSEMVYVATGPRIGVAVQALPYSLAPVITEARPTLRLGVFISPDTQVYARPGCKLGTNTISSLSRIQVSTPGIALGNTNLSQIGGIASVSAGVRIGLRGGIDPDYEYVLALLRMNGENYAAAFVDDSPYARTVNVLNEVYTDTTQKKYGSASARFNIFSPYGGLLLGADPAFALGSSNFTIEAWVRPNTLSGDGFQVLASYGSTYEGAWQLVFLEGTYVGDGPYLALTYCYLDNTNTAQFDVFVIDYSSYSPATWQHIAFVRNGNTGRLYVGGVARTDIVTSSTSHDFTERILTVTDPNPQLTLGFAKDYSADSTYTAHYDGHMDDFRLTRGVARYTSNFTPPTKELPAS